jgi:predicted AlkP superfamily pyrophosphatase or phosphodiesterase
MVPMQESGSGTPAPFNKVVFMVVDALRSDFVFGEDSAMEFVQRCVLILPYIQSVD